MWGNGKLSHEKEVRLAEAPLRRRILYAMLIAGWAVVAWSNCWRVPFILDDQDSITENPTIRALGNWRAVLSPPHGGVTVSGRPLLNLSLALNWAVSGPDVWSYHLFNVAGHVLCGLLLFGLARRTLRRVPHLAPWSAGLAASIALLWTLHPLQTESVTYVVQRAEMLMGLFYLGTLYAVIRSAEFREVHRKSRAVGWELAAASACLLGMLSKEVMVSAPLIALLFDAAFFGGSLRQAWRRRPWLWLMLAAGWVPLALLVAANGQRGGTSGFGVGIPAWQYWWTQGPALLRYLQLTLWPHPLILDYGLERQWLNRPLSALPGNLLLMAVVVSAWPIWRRWPKWGCLLLWFLAVLSPTSIVPGNRQSVAEHRMYLALAPAIAGLVVAAWRFLRVRRHAAIIGAALITGVGIIDAAAIQARNRDYLNPERMWRQAVAQTPGNLFAHLSLGATLYFAGRWDEAEVEFRRAIAIDPRHSASHSNLGVLEEARGEPRRAMEEYRLALAGNPRSHQAWNNYGISLAALGRWAEAADSYRRALALYPFYPDAMANEGIAERALGRLPESERCLREAFAEDPRKADNAYHLGVTLRLEGKWAEAIAAQAAALHLRPKFGAAREDWGQTLMAVGKPAEAQRQFEAAMADGGATAPLWLNRGLALAGQGQAFAAVADYDRAIALNPNYADAHADRAAALLSLHRAAEAVQSLERASALAPRSAEIRYDLGLAYREVGRVAEAAGQYREALRLNPELYQAENNLAAILAAQGHLAEAIGLLRGVVKRHPDFAIGRQSLEALLNASRPSGH